MALPTIDSTIGAISRRCSTPTDLEVVTCYGDESGPSEQPDAIWALVQDVYRSGMHPGIQVCIRHEGAVVLDRSIGQARGVSPGQRFDRNRAVPLTLDTPINLFSAAKGVTGMAMHKLEEPGALRLDDAVAEHVPGFEQHGKERITIRHVLTHRAGIAAIPAEAFDLDVLGDPEELEQISAGCVPPHSPGPFRSITRFRWADHGGRDPPCDRPQPPRGPRDRGQRTAGARLARLWRRAA